MTQDEARALYLAAQAAYRLAEANRGEPVEAAADVLREGMENSGMGYREREKHAAEALAALLERPLASEVECISIEDFGPWEIVPCVYGSYSSEFDDMAITVLENMAARDSVGESLAHEMFREMLCNAGLCDYGTSPRGCFPTQDFAPLLPRLLERWKEWRTFKWEPPSSR